MFVSLFPVDIHPLGVEGELHFMLSNLRGLIVIERVTVFVPGAGAEADERLFVVHMIILLYLYYREKESEATK